MKHSQPISGRPRGLADVADSAAAADTDTITMVNSNLPSPIANCVPMNTEKRSRGNTMQKVDGAR